MEKVIFELAAKPLPLTLIRDPPENTLGLTVIDEVMLKETDLLFPDESVAVRVCVPDAPCGTVMLILNEPLALTGAVVIKTLLIKILTVELAAKLVPVTVSCEPTVVEVALNVTEGEMVRGIEAVLDEASVALMVWLPPVAEGMVILTSKEPLLLEGVVVIWLLSK
jgi:hypothetical protein